MAKAIVTRAIKYKTNRSVANVEIERIHDVKPSTKTRGINEGHTMIIMESGTIRYTVESVEEINRAIKEAQEG